MTSFTLVYRIGARAGSMHESGAVPGIRFRILHRSEHEASGACSRYWIPNALVMSGQWNVGVDPMSAARCVASQSIPGRSMSRLSSLARPHGCRTRFPVVAINGAGPGRWTRSNVCQSSERWCALGGAQS